MIDRDNITVVKNRDEFKRRLADTIGDARMKGSGLALLYIDIDNMKHFNMHNGHLVGDEMLERFVALVEPMLGNRHSLFRTSGDEFAIIFSNSSREEALQLSQQICDISREKLAPPQPTHCGDRQCLGPAKISVSVGVGLFEQNMNAESFLQSIENKMYHAKSAGKDRVCI